MSEQEVELALEKVWAVFDTIESLSSIGISKI